MSFAVQVIMRHARDEEAFRRFVDDEAVESQDDHEHVEDEGEDQQADGEAAAEPRDSGLSRRLSEDVSDASERSTGLRISQSVTLAMGCWVVSYLNSPPGLLCG